MNQAAVPLLALALSGCSLTQTSASQALDAAEETETFVGSLIALDGRDAGGSQLVLRLFVEGSGAEARPRSLIANQCADLGYLDAQSGRYFSGLAPAVNRGMNLAIMGPASDPARRCPVEDPARYAGLMQLMYSGAALTFEEEGRIAVLTDQSGASARFEREAPSPLVD